MSNQYILYAGILLFIVVATIIILYFKKKYDAKIIPHGVGTKTIYIERRERKHFESLPRNEQRKLVSRFHAQLKRGRFLPVYKDGKVVGYTKNPRWKGKV